MEKDDYDNDDDKDSKDDNDHDIINNAGWIIRSSPPRSNDVYDNEVVDDDEFIARVEDDGNHGDNNE